MSYKLTQTGQEVQALLNQIKNGGQSQVTDAVLYTPQNLGEKEQEQARKNIGAAAENQIPTGAVLYSQKQDLESNQQAQARANIDAAGTEQLPKKVSELENDTHYITENQVPVALPQQTGAIQSGVLPTTGWDVLDEGWKESTLSMQRRRYGVTYGNGMFVAVEYSSSNGGYSTDGITWKYSTMPASRSWRSVTYGNGKFVAVSYSTTAAYSTDGIHWTETTMPVSGDWYSVTYGNGKFVAVACDSDKGAYSTDGITWVETTLSASKEWHSVTYGNGKFVAVACDSSYGAYSTDGINWTSMQMPARRQWYSVTYGNGKFVATTYVTTAAYSTDGITWTATTMPVSGDWYSVAYGNGKFVAVAGDSNKSAYSMDGITWTATTMPVSGDWRSVTYGNGRFVAVAYISDKGAYWTEQVTYSITDTDITTNSDVLMELTDKGGAKARALVNGSIQVIRDTVPTQPIPYTYKVKQTNASGQFTVLNHYVPAKTSELANDSGFITQVAIPTIPTNLPVTYKKASGNLPTSGWNTLYEGWIQSTLPASRSWRSLTYGAGKYVAIAFNDIGGIYSTDGVTWTEMSMPANQQWSSIAYGNSKFVAIAWNSNKGAYSTDGITWTEMTLPASQKWQSVIYGNDKFVAVAFGGDKGAYSTDGITWTEMTLPLSKNWSSVTYGNGKFVAVISYDAAGAYSTDGVTWTQTTLPARRDWVSVTYGDGKFVAFAYSTNKGAYSTDGITWTETTLPKSGGWRNATYGNGKFVVGAYNAQYGVYSTDGINWTTMSMPASRDWRSVIYGDGKFVAVAADSSAGAYWNVFAQPTYTIAITDTDITTNTSVKMYLTDEGGAKAQSKANGSITVIRDTVPTTAIPYEYEVEQTSEEGLFEVINGYVPNVSVTSVNGQTGAVTIAVPTKTSELTNDSGFVTQAAIPTKVSQLANDRGFTTNIGTITQVKVNGEIKAPDTAGLVDLGNVTPEPTDWTTVPITTALENGKTYVVKLDTTPYPLTAIFTMSAALDAIDANVVGGTQQGTDGTSTYELKSATITVKDGKLTGLKSTNLVSSANPGAANLSYSESTFSDLGITQYHYVELLNTVGGGGAASYKAIKATLTPSDWQEVTKQAFFVGEDTMQWPIDDAFELHAKRSNDIIGLTSGVDYTMSVTVDGQIYTKTAQMVDPSQTGGMKVLLFYLDDDNTLCVAIYDDISAMMPGVGSVALIEAPETVTSLVITAFSGVDFGSSGKATITDSAIKVNSAVTLYVNTSEKISVGEKANGSVTLVADSVPTVAIPYSLEIVGTDTEGLFELVNGYIPPDAPTALPQKTSAIKTGTLPKGENYVQVTDSDITANSDIIVNVSYKKEITGDFAPGIFALSVSNDAAEEDIPFTYKVKQTDGKGQFTVVNSYIPQQILPLEKNVTNESTSLGHKVVTITGSSKPYLFTVKDSDVSASVFVRLYPADENTETWLNEHTLSSIITEESGEFTFKVDTDTLPATFNIKYIIETFTKEE